MPKGKRELTGQHRLVPKQNSSRGEVELGGETELVVDDLKKRKLLEVGSVENKRRRSSPLDDKLVASATNKSSLVEEADELELVDLSESLDAIRHQKPPASPLLSTITARAYTQADNCTHPSGQPETMTSSLRIAPIQTTPIDSLVLADQSQTTQDVDSTARMTTTARNISNNNRKGHNTTSHGRHERVTEVQLDRLSLLIKIIRSGDYNEFLELIERRGFKNLLNVFIDGQTALHYSLIYGRSLAWCKQLVLNGANPNLANRAGWHPIHLAAFNGSRETMRYLIDCIAN